MIYVRWGALSSAEFAPVRSLWYPTWYPGGRWQAEREAEGDATVTCGSSAPFGEPSSSLDHLDVLPRHRLLRQPAASRARVLKIWNLTLPTRRVKVTAHDRPDRNRGEGTVRSSLVFEHHDADGTT